MGVDRKKILQYFENAYSQYYKELCVCAFRYIADADRAEDIVQDVFLDLWIKKETIDFSSSLQPLLYRLTKNKSIDILRSVQYKNEEIVSEYPQESFLVSYVREMVINQEDQLHFKELSSEIQYSIDHLPEQCKKIFTLSRMFNLKNREIAEILGIGIKAVEKQITKALSEIRRHLTHKGLVSILWIFF